MPRGGFRQGSGRKKLNKKKEAKTSIIVSVKTHQELSKVKKGLSWEKFFKMIISKFK